MSYGPPDWNSTTPLSDSNLQDITDSIEWQHQATPYLFDTDGNQITNANGLGKVVGKVDVDPATYPGYVNGGHCGSCVVTFPAGLFSELISVQVTFASGANWFSTCTVQDESAASVQVNVCDYTGTTMEAFVLWIEATGKLNSGKIP